ncbi:MAG: CoA synthetase [Candidatus Rokuibacteriota bacterium]|nr:MAG: CoA synthetase [Candidatus Rokubacteria bacterium]
MRHLHRLQRRGRAEAGAAPTGPPVDRDDGERHGSALLHDGPVRRGQARRGPGAGASDGSAHAARARPLPAEVGDPHLNPAEYDFIAARRRIEGKAKSAAEKLTSLEEAASRVKDGDQIGVGGCLFSRTPLALMREILRQRRSGLTLARNLTCHEGELFMAAGAVSRVMTAWMSIGLPWGVSKILRHYVETGAVALEEWSHLALGLRFRAGAMGIPFLPALTMLGSDLVGVGGLKTVQDPYTGETLAAVPALFPDVALVHVHRADRFGNCQVDGYPHMDADIARAATTVLITTEEIISEEETRRYPDRTVIPGFVVDALVHVPFGSFPHECYGLYEADYDHFAEYCAAIDARGPAAVGDYLERYVYGPPTWSDYLELFGGERMGLQAKRARELTR